MGNAYGFMEITGVVAATDALDIMCKRQMYRWQPGSVSWVADWLHW